MKKDIPDEHNYVLEGFDQFYLGEHGAEEFVDLLGKKQLENNPEQLAIFIDSLLKLSKEAKEVINLVLNLPDELLEFIKYEKTEYKLTMNILREYLRFYGWKYRKIEKAFNDIKNIL